MNLCIFYFGRVLNIEHVKRTNKESHHFTQYFVVLVVNCSTFMLNNIDLFAISWKSASFSMSHFVLGWFVLPDAIGSGTSR